MKAVLLAVLAALTLTVAAGACVNHQFNTFVSKCQFDLTRMRNQVDPIVQHGVKPSAHSHDFYGWIRPTQDTVANTTLPAGTTSNPGYSPVVSTCGIYGDWPSYWFPTPVDGPGGPFVPNHTDPAVRTVEAANMIATYRSPVGVTVLPVPYGMTYVAGNSKATSPAESPHLSWTCGPTQFGFPNPVNCAGTGRVTAVLEFPDCWNQQHGWGANGWDAAASGLVVFDGAAGIAPANFVYSVDGVCPAGYTPMSQLVTRTHFANPVDNTPMTDPSRLFFSSGPFYTYHGDFLNVWSKFVQTLTFKCNNLLPVVTVDCLTGLGATLEEAAQ
jgi:hypothetical protein